jgi:hypothetical protein
MVSVKFFDRITYYAAATMIPKYNIVSKRKYSSQDHIRRLRFSKTLPALGCTFHPDFGCEILGQARYERLTLYSLEHLRLADKALGWIKGE